MQPLSNIFATLPQPLFNVTLYIIAILGAVLITYAVFLEREKLQDAVFVIGSACLLVYALWVGSLVFVIAMGGLFLASLVEMIEIYLGFHKDIGEKQKDNKKISGISENN